MMTILRRLDAWLAKTLFHPPIILACQLTRQTQHAMHRALWFLVACHLTYYSQGGSWGLLAFVWFYTIWMFVWAAAFADHPSFSFGVFRFVIWLGFGMEALGTIGTGEIRAIQIREVMILFAEYAATIRSIPPRRPREKRTSAREAFNGQ
ncbi:hypothetical protein ACFOKF_16370 [Sphingobium rhizovicinum]|uniref:Uncharacterized protein n=1 Tax=Sphingobium rhizovicinum TaxID=432308 RepID=A0ABV7NKT4_9SPHN